MVIQFEYPNIRELSIQKIDVIDEEGIILSQFELNEEDLTWYAECEVDDSICIYQFVINEYIKFNDPYAYEYMLKEDGIWSVRYSDLDQIIVGKESVESVSTVISNQFNNSVQASRMKKVFYTKIDQKVTVGVEIGSAYGLHELVIIWYSPNEEVYHIDNQIIEPEVEGERYSLISWFKMVLKDIEQELLDGIWNINILLDGELIGYEQFDIEENYLNEIHNIRG